MLSKELTQTSRLTECRRGHVIARPAVRGQAGGANNAKHSITGRHRILSAP